MSAFRLILCSHYLFVDRQVYILGCAGIRDELDAMNIKNFGVGPDPLPDNCEDLVPAVNTDERVDGVIVGYDNLISLPKLVKVSPHLILCILT